MIAAENSVENKSLSDTDAVSDILDGQQDSLSQNEPKSSDVPTGKVV